MVFNAPLTRSAKFEYIMIESSSILVFTKQLSHIIGGEGLPLFRIQDAMVTIVFIYDKREPVNRHGICETRQIFLSSLQAVNTSAKKFVELSEML